MFGIKRVFSRKNPPPETVSKTFRLPKLMVEKLEAAAAQEGDSLNVLVVLVLDGFLQEVEKQKAPVDPPAEGRTGT